MAIIIFSLILCLSMAIIVFLGAYTMIRSENKQKNLFVAMMIPAFFYVFGYFLEINSLSADGAFIAVKVMYVGSAFVVPLFLLFVASYCDVKINRIITTVLLVTALLNVGIVWTTNSHNLFYSAYTFDTDNFLPTLRVIGGPLYPAPFIHGLISTLTVITILAYRFVKTDKKNRRMINSLIIFAAGTAISIIAQVLFIIDPYDLAVHYTALSICIFMVFNYINVLKNDMFDIMPRASQMAINSMKDAYILVDKNRALLSVNESAREFFPIIKELKKFDSLSKIDGFPPELTSIKGKKFLEKITFRAADKRFYDASVSPIIADNENLLGYVILIRDITDINDALEAANLANLSKSKFLATMSHEIRTPMNAIIGISDIELTGEDHPPGTRDAFNRIGNSGKTLLGIINDILDLSKIETGKLELVPVKYDTASLINDTVRLNTMRIDDKPIEFVLNVAETLPSCLFGDELRIKQILNNILSNAIKYTHRGKVTFEIDSQAVEDGVTLIFTIRDTGQGMSKEQLDILFDEYSMFNQEANRMTEGTGLGMSIAKNLVEMMSGKITVESEPDVGTVFTVNLLQQPIDDNVIGKVLADNLQEFKFTGKVQRIEVEREYMPYGSVLIVDDVDANLFVANGLMKPYGLAIETVLSGYEALDKIKDGKLYDIIFMDHMMPGMDGIETTKLIRETGYTQPVIALSANAIAGQSEVFLESGFDDFISKPIDVRQLNEALNKHIRDKHKTPQLSPQQTIDNFNIDPAPEEASGTEDVYQDKESAESECNMKGNETGLKKIIAKMKIRQKILLLVLAICLFSILSISITFLISKDNFSNHSKEVTSTLSAAAADGAHEALVSQAHHFLQVIAREQSVACDTLLNSIKFNVLLMEGVVQDLFNNSYAYTYIRPIINLSDVEYGEYTNTYFLSENIPMTDSIRDEINLLSNMNLLLPILAADPNIMQLYVGMESGLLYNYTRRAFNNPIFDPRIRPWYLAAVQNPDDVIFTDVYEDAFGNGMVLTAAKAIHCENGNLLGVAGLDILLENLKDIIYDIRITDSGYAFIIDSEGMYIVHPEMGQEGFPSSVSERDFHMIADLSEGYRRMMNGEEGFIESGFNGEIIFMAFSPISVAGWSIGLIVYEDELLAPLRPLISKMDSFAMEAEINIDNMWSRSVVIIGVFIGIILIMIFLLSANLTKIVSKPIQKLTEEVVRIGEGDFEYRIPVQSHDEIGFLTESFNNMTDNIYNFASATKAAEQANLSKSNFLTTMSHEIRTPMNAIIGISDIELDSDDHPNETRDSFERIRSSGKTLLGIINDILDLSKIETGKLELIPIEYNTPNLINDTVRLNTMRIGNKPISFIVKVSETLPLYLFGDELRIKQILNNILSNAIKYTEQGSVTFEVDSIIDNDDVTLIFTVRDTGQGMTEEQLNAIYDDYSMFNREANRATEGTGLGMGITKNLVEMMNGKIIAQSIPDLGSVFTISLHQKLTGDDLKIGKEIAEKLQSFKFTEGTKRAKLVREYMPYGRVLIVDDVDANLFVAKGLMKPYGLEIETVLSGYEALDLVRAGNQYNVIFMDHMMPGMDGMETTKLIREHGYTQPIVALTANAIAGQSEAFLENGFDDFISKPIDTRQLNNILNTLIRDKQPGQGDGSSAPEGQGDGSSVPEFFNFQLSTLKTIPALNVDAALDAMSGLQDVYIDTVKLTVRLLPERIEKMDQFIGTDMKSFTVEVHGLKSVLKNIGATVLGNQAASLERAALENDQPYCDEHYPPFRAGLTELKESLDAAFQNNDEQPKDAADSSELIKAINEAKTAAEVFNRDGALEVLAPYMHFTYGDETDGQLKEIVFALEAFDCEKALELMVKLVT